jgi:hypothetical protein
MRRTLLLLCGLLLGCSTVPTAPDSVAVQLVMRAPGSDVYVGEGLALDATALDQYGDSTATDPIEWSVDVPTLARVSPRGTLTGLAPGVVTVTARSGPIATHRSVTVHSSDPVQMWLSIPQTGLPLGGTAQLGTEVMAELGHLLVNPSVTWSVSPSGVVTVDGKGLVTAIGMGTAAVTATAGRISRSVTFQVPLAYPVSMSFAVVKSILGLGDTVMIAPRVISNRGQEMTGTQITWSSDQPEIATVSR